MKLINSRNIVFSAFTAMLAFVMMLPAVALAGPVPDTGQTACYDDAGNVITCPQPGQPFYGQDAQYGTNTQSYTKLDASANDLPDSASSWAMVRDNLTDLIWECKTDDNSIHDKDNTCHSPDAQQLINQLNAAEFGGFSDWRLPDVKELSCIVNMSRMSPAVNPDYFPNLILYYWSANPTPVVSGTKYCNYYVQVQNGYVYNFYHASSPGGVMGVRGDSSGAASNFIDNKNGSVSDTTTRLMWQQGSSAQTMNWQQSLAYCENLDLAGYTDWRLPNVHELQSIVDYTRYNPSINTDYFPSTTPAFYYTSTTRNDSPDYAWTIMFDYGYVNLYFGSDKLTPYLARCVRDDSTSTTTTIISTTTTTAPAVTTTIQPTTTTTEQPTAIELSFLTATPANRAIVVAWKTESEINNAGFNVYRAESKNGEYTKLNTSLISTKGSSTQGASYEFIDNNVQNRKTYYYKLEDIDLNGTSTMHGPVSAMPRLIYGIGK
jgi:hypothetical protein